MDIVTHALMGATLAAPILSVAPVTGSCLLLGSVLPDIDALSRCFGKLFFLRCHQTYTHGMLVIAIAGLTAWLLVPEGLEEPWAPLALMAGMLLHVGLDLCNTYGTAVLSPFSSRRYCTEWVFFIDAFVLFACAAGTILQYLPRHELRSGWQQSIAVAFVFVLISYWAIRILLHSRATALAPSDTVSLIPSALLPWRYFGCARGNNRVLVFRLNALTGLVDQVGDLSVLDALYESRLCLLPEYRAMRELSSAYHVTDAVPTQDGICLTCRDLRVRNFGGHFGELTVLVNPDGQLARKWFNV